MFSVRSIEEGQSAFSDPTLEYPTAHFDCYPYSEGLELWGYYNVAPATRIDKLKLENLSHNTTVLDNKIVDHYPEQQIWYYSTDQAGLIPGDHYKVTLKLVNTNEFYFEFQCDDAPKRKL